MIFVNWPCRIVLEKECTTVMRSSLRESVIQEANQQTWRSLFSKVGFESRFNQLDSFEI